MIPDYCIAHLYCAQCSRHYRVYVHNDRKFPQARRDSEINARFLLNEQVDLEILLYRPSYNTVPKEGLGPLADGISNQDCLQAHARMNRQNWNLLP